MKTILMVLALIASFSMAGLSSSTAVAKDKKHPHMKKPVMPKKKPGKKHEKKAEEKPPEEPAAPPAEPPAEPPTTDQN